MFYQAYHSSDCFSSLNISNGFYSVALGGATLIDWGMNNEFERGRAKTKAPYTHDEENEALYFTPDPFGGKDTCKKLQQAIIVLRAQIAWRQTDLNSLSSTYSTHKTRIAILIAALIKLERAYRDICGGDCPA